MNPEQVDELMISHDQYYPYSLQFLPEEHQGEGAKAQAQAQSRRRRSRKKKLDGELGGVNVMMRKRKLGEEQVKLLEESFGSEHKLESERKERLAAELGLDPRQVAVWFQNRRARWKAKKLEEEYTKLKSDLDNALLHKCRLHTQVLKLKEQLHEAEKEIQRLSDGLSSNSPCSSNFTMELQAVGVTPFLGEFQGLEHVFYASNHGLMDWDHTLYYV